MNWYSVFYWFSVADNVSTFFAWVAGLGTAASIIGLIITIFGTVELDKNDNEDVKSFLQWRKWFWRIYIMAIIGWMGYVFTPDKKDMLLIVAGGAVGNFLSSDSSAKKLPSDLTTYLHTAIQKEVADMKDIPIETKKAMGLTTPKEEFVDKLKDLTKEEILERIKTDTTVVK